MKATKRLEKKEKKNNQEIKEIFELKEKNRPLTALLKNKIGYQQLEQYPQEVDYYLARGKEKKDKLEAERDKINKKIKSASGEKLARKLRRKNDLETRIKELDKEQQRNIFPKYLSYITNNERL